MEMREGEGHPRLREKEKERERENAHISLTMKRLHRQVHLRAPTHCRRKRHGHYIHYDSSFRNNNEAGRGHVCLRRRILHLGHVVSPREEMETLTKE